MREPAAFQGFHREAIAFFEGLAADNSRAYWEAHRDVYESHVRAPMEALAGSLEGLFGSAHLYRPYRDLRFTKDKRPYKENAAVSFGGRGPRAAAGRHVHLDAGGIFVAAGAYRLEGETLAAYRRAAAAPRPGEALRRVLDELKAQGYEIHGEQLKRAPQGVAPDHPRAGLLRRKGVAAVRTWSVEPWLFTPEAGDRIVRALADAEPLVAWLQSHVA